MSAVWRVSFPFIPSPKDLNAVPAHLVKNTAHMDALLHAPSDTSAAQFIFLPGITQRGGFHPAFVRRQNPLFWRKPHESNMGAASAPLHRFRRFFAFVSPGIAPALYISRAYTHYPDSWVGLGAGELTVCRSISGCQQAVSLSCALSLWAMRRRLFRCVSKVYRLAFRPAFTDGCDPASLSLLAF